MVCAVDTPTVELRGVEKSFGDHRALDGVDLRIATPGVVGLLGPNGAGKTTLIRIMAGLTRPDAGTVRVAGRDLARSPARAGEVIGLAPQDLGLYPQLTARQNLLCFAGMSGLGHRDARARADELLDLFDLTPQARRRAESLSGGQKRRLHTAMALVHRPRVLFLDEPTVGADVTSRSRILDVVRQLCADGATVVYTTHYLHEVEELAGRVVVLTGGRVAVDAPVADVLRRWARPDITVEFAGEPPRVEGWTGRGHTLTPAGPVDNPTAALARLLSDESIQAAGLVAVDIRPSTLETAYLRIVSAAQPREAPDVLAA